MPFVVDWYTYTLTGELWDVFVNICEKIDRNIYSGTFQTICALLVAMLHLKLATRETSRN